MTASRSQSDSAGDKTASVSQPENSRQSNAPETPSARDNGRGHIPLTTDQAKGGRSNSTPKRRIEDHPAWSAYLVSRHILEPAIAAGAWVEQEAWTGQDVLVWPTRRRDGRPGATRRRLLKKLKVKGKKHTKVRWQVAGEKKDEPFYYVGTLEDLKREIARAGGKVYIVEGEFDVWSLHRLGIRNVIGIYGISNIPKDMGAILDEIGAASFVYLADNDKAGEKGGSNLRTLLHQSSWKGEGDYRKVAGAGIPDKGDANDLLCRHFPDVSAARAALEALPRFEPRLKRAPLRKPASEIDYDQSGWDAVKEAIRIALGIGPGDFKSNGFSKNFSCFNPEHDHDDDPSAGWHKDGYCKCFKCHGPGESFNAMQMATWLNIDWRAILRAQRQIAPSKAIDLDAAPQAAEREPAPLSLEQAPDTWLRLLIKFYTKTVALLFLFVLRAQAAGLLPKDFTRQELLKALRELGCNVSKETIYKVFQEVAKVDNHPLFVKIDPSQGSGSRYCKFRLRSAQDIKRRLAQGIGFRVYEKKFREHGDILIGFKVFADALQGSKFTKTLQAALEPLYREQKPRFDSLTNSCEGIIAGHLAELDDVSATPLPDWTIDKPSELPALLARGIYDEDPEDRGKRKWAPQLGIGPSSVPSALERAAIKRTAYTIKEEVASQREAKDRARELGAKIVGLEVDGSYLRYDAAMDIPEGSKAIYQPPARHEIISDEKQIVKTPPTKSHAETDEQRPLARAHNMQKPGNWTKNSWDPQFIYWELVKACCLLHGYQVLDGVGIVNPETGEVWTDPTLDEVVALISGEPAATKPDPG